MEMTRNVVYVRIEDNTSQKKASESVKRSILASTLIALLAIATVSWMENHYQEKLKEARMEGALSCQVAQQAQK